MPAQHHILDAFWVNSGLMERLGAAPEGILAPFLAPFGAPGAPLGNSWAQAELRRKIKHIGERAFVGTTCMIV